MDLILLLCVIGVTAAAPSDSTNVHYDVIVIGLGSAGTTAATELARAGRHVLGLEASDRVGGRVQTVPFGDGVVELGAEWIHGNESSRTYQLATQHDIDLQLQPFALAAYRSDGSEANSTVLTELLDLDLSVDLPDPPEDLGSFSTRKYLEYITKNYPELLKDQDFITEFLEFANLLTNNLEASNDWKDVTTYDIYESLGGPQTISWHRHGYKTFFEIMLNTYKSGPGLPNLHIKLQKEVTLIKAPRTPEEKVTVQCKDGTSYSADYAIVTVSLGVLKATQSSLFSPPLPKDKQTAIEKINMGVVGKIILSFDEAWWPQNISLFSFIWKGEDKTEVPAADYWTTRILGAHPPKGSSNTLTLWTNGNVAKEVETLPEAVVKSKTVKLLQRFMGDALKVTVPQPTGFLRSTWYSNPFTRGTYSFDGLQTPQYPDARAWLGSPVVDSTGSPRVLFAGEATSVHHFSTVHGASETGHREAERLLKITKKEQSGIGMSTLGNEGEATNVHHFSTVHGASETGHREAETLLKIPKKEQSGIGMSTLGNEGQALTLLLAM